ncbi:MAG: YdcF family protein [Oscillospiraceae bacterium]|nr:YdcF family protein [Oscillospiraceae bacterium]
MPKKRIWLIAAAAVLTIFSLLNITEADCAIGRNFLFAITLWALFNAIFYNTAERLKKTLPALFWTVRVILALIAAMVAVMLIYPLTERPEGEERLVLVLGAKYAGDEASLIMRERLEKALEYLERNPEASAVLCGGQVPGEPMPEAEIMRIWLLARGISEDRLYLDSASRTTRENLSRALEIIHELGVSEDEPLLIITSSFHCMRVRAYATDAGIQELSFLLAPTVWYEAPLWYLREALASVRYCFTSL